MKTKIKYFIPVVCLLGLMSATSVFAQTTAISTTTRINALRAKVASTTNTQAISKLIAQSDKEITQRIDSLNALITRVQQMKKVVGTEQTNIVSQIQSVITSLNTLKTKIDADTDTATLRTDLQTITKDYRVYMLILPQTQIIAASDRIDTIDSDFSAIVSKLQTRITEAQTAGKDVSSLQTIITDVQNKISDAQTQAQNAVSTVVSLTPDQGVQTTAQANTSALKQARADIKTATTDLQTAKNDAENILKGIQAFHLSNTVVSTSTATSTQ